MLMLVLVSISSQSGKVWSHGEKQNQYRQRARTALDYIGREMRQATLDLDPDSTRLQFVINPATVVSTAYRCRDSVFWQAPIATDVNKAGLAEVGYFVMWSNGSDGQVSQANLCRYYVNPSDADYKIYSNPGAWVTDSLIGTVAPADAAHNYHGLFLENVLGLWVKAYQADGVTAYNGDSRVVKRLPAYVDISLVLVDEANARKLKQTGKIAAVRSLYTSTADATAFTAAMENVLPGAASVVSLRVSLDNYK